MVSLAVVPALLTTGCAISMHSMKNVEVTLTESATGKPVPKAPIRVSYSYDSYGVFHVFRTPDELRASTDENGMALLRVATYGWSIELDVDPNRTGNFGGDAPHFRLHKQLVREGGVIESFGGRPALRLKIEPVKQEANHPAAGQAGIASLIAIEHH